MATKENNFPLSFEEACQHKGYDQLTILPYKNPQNELETVCNTRMMLDIIAKDIQGGKKVDLSDGKPKWFGVFRVTLAGFGFSRTDYDYGFTVTCVGSRLSFYERAQAEHFYGHPNFLPLHKIVNE